MLALMDTSGNSLPSGSDGSKRKVSILHIYKLQNSSLMAEICIKLALMDTSGNSLPSRSDGSKRKVCYFYDSEVGNYYYGQGHPMKPLKMRMTH
ncbi:hypothetical protein ACJIZ3_023727 [Penstemon smallii]|uniref:Histone deacetylase n=1 Tax=Penstemon smallii TaxID=265156 RepID=A0ABD3TPU6_9LAMI